MDSEKSELRWGVEQRIGLTEFHPFWEGHLNGSVLMEQYGVSLNQVSMDLKHYIGFAPDNMVYDKSARTYVRGPAFKPRFLEPDASRSLAQLRLVADGILDRSDLTEMRAKVIALDYGTRVGEAKIKVRRALLYYALKRIGRDTAPKAHTPQDQQIVFINRDEIIRGTPVRSAREATL